MAPASLDRKPRDGESRTEEGKGEGASEAKKSGLRRFLRPSFILPAILSISLVGGLIAFSGGGKVLGALVHFRPIWLLPFAAVLLGYQAVRLLQWHLLLHEIGVKAPLRTEALSYFTGEVAKYFPGGTFLQNYILLEARGTDVGLSTSATTAAILLEPLGALLLLLVVGVAGWPWVRPLIVVGLLVLAGLVLGVERLGPGLKLPHAVEGWRAVRYARRELKGFRQGLARMRDLRLLPIQVFLAILYIFLGGLGLYVVLLGLGTAHADWLGSVSAYAFGVSVALVVPLMTDLGTLEVSSVAALASAGVSTFGASAAVILDRALMILVPALVTLGIALVWRDLVRRVLSEGTPDPPPGESLPGDATKAAAD